jgi:hypothetical protein
VANDKSCQNITLDASCLLCDLRKNLAVVEASEFTSSWPSAMAAGISISPHHPAEDMLDFNQTSCEETISV